MKKTVSKSALTIYEKMGQVNAGALSSEQILHIMQKTPANHVYKRPGKGGGQWEFVTGAYIEKVLNYVFAWDWDFTIKEVKEVPGQIAVLGELVARANGKTITKNQWGRIDVKYKKGTKEYLDYGNDLKGASTDALKKCASLFGIASDIYGKQEFKEIQTEVVDIKTPEEIAEEKENQRIREHIKNAKTIEELEQCDSAIDNSELRELYNERRKAL